MTNTEQRSTAPTDYESTIRVNAEPNAVFDALTTADGLTAWWVRAAGSGESGGELEFFDHATRPTSLQWTVTHCSFEPDWVGTRPTWTITPVDGNASDLHFRHHGLTTALECIEMCTRGWNHYLESLQAYVEVGRGMPQGSDEDTARRRSGRL
jgi:uncharacterized protein YndB with AHSA1/START domain